MIAAQRIAFTSIAISAMVAASFVLMKFVIAIALLGGSVDAGF